MRHSPLLHFFSQVYITSSLGVGSTSYVTWILSPIIPLTVATRIRDGDVLSKTSSFVRKGYLLNVRFCQILFTFCCLLLIRSHQDIILPEKSKFQLMSKLPLTSLKLGLDKFYMIVPNCSCVSGIILKLSLERRIRLVYIYKQVVTQEAGHRFIPGHYTLDIRITYPNLTYNSNNTNQLKKLPSMGYSKIPFRALNPKGFGIILQ